MKPTRDGEDVARDMTSEKLLDPNMTQDEPEREKVEEITRESMARALWNKNWGMLNPDDKLYWLGKAEIAIRLFDKTVSTSEKRAEELGIELVHEHAEIEALQSELSTALVVANNYQSLMVTAQRETGEARRRTEEMRGILDNTIAWQKAAFVERDELRSSLARVVEALKIADIAMTRDFCGWGDELNAIRSALHRSQGE